MSKQKTIQDIIESRRTIHNFRPDPPPRETVLRCIEAARWAPNHYLTEPWHFYLLGPETRRTVVELNSRLVTRARGAEAGAVKRSRWAAVPGWLVVTCDLSEEEVRWREDYAACCCAVQNLALLLWAEGIGMKWTTGEVTRHADFYDAIWVDPEAERVVGMLWYGFPAEIPRTQRKPMEQILCQLP